MEGPASAAGMPIAVSTCEGSTAPLEQAEPEETAIPSRSSPISSASGSAPGTETLLMVGRRAAPAPFTTSPETASRSPASSRSRSAETRAIAVSRSASAASAAAAKPAAPATSSVPGRIPRSSPPPKRSGWRRVPLRT